jgi:RNA recognition motif-containing protein
MNKKLYVGNLVYECTDEELKDVFAQVGNVVSASIIKFRDSGRSKGFGFVEMEDEAGAQKAIDTLNGQDFKGRKMVVSEARPPKPRNEFGGGGRRGGYGGGGGYGGDQGQQM